MEYTTPWPKHRNRWLTDENGNTVYRDGKPVRFSGPIGNQAFFFESNYPFTHIYRLFVAGWGSGKTVTGARSYIEAAMENPGCLGLICARDLPQLKKATLRALEDAFDDVEQEYGYSIVSNHNKSDHYYTLVNGFIIYYSGTMTPRALVGPSATLIWWDEPYSSDDPDGVWKALNSRFRGEPKTQRMLFQITGTPDGKQGPMMQWERRCKLEIAPRVWIGKGEDSQWLMVNMRSDENDGNRKGYARDLMAGLSQQDIQAECYGLFTDPKGKVFSGSFANAYFPGGNITGFYEHDPQTCDMYVAIDWGDRYNHVLWISHIPEFKHDPTMPADVIVDEWCEDDVSYHKVIQVIKEREKRWGGYKGITPDPAGRVENLALEKAFKGRSGFGIFKHSKKDLRDIRWGVTKLRGRLLNGLGARRLLIHQDVAHSIANTAIRGRGIVSGLTNYDFKRSRDGTAKTGEYFDDSWFVHGCDTARYYVTFQYQWEEDDLSPERHFEAGK